MAWLARALRCDWRAKARRGIAFLTKNRLAAYDLLDVRPISISAVHRPSMFRGAVSHLSPPAYPGEARVAGGPVCEERPRMTPLFLQCDPCVSVFRRLLGCARSCDIDEDLEDITFRPYPERELAVPDGSPSSPCSTANVTVLGTFQRKGKGVVERGGRALFVFFQFPVNRSF